MVWPRCFARTLPPPRAVPWPAARPRPRRRSAQRCGAQSRARRTGITAARHGSPSGRSVDSVGHTFVLFCSKRVPNMSERLMSKYLFAKWSKNEYEKIWSMSKDTCSMGISARWVTSNSTEMFDTAGCWCRNWWHLLRPEAEQANDSRVWKADTSCAVCHNGQGAETVRKRQRWFWDVLSNI